jgi:hypothetical protein
MWKIVNLIALFSFWGCAAENSSRDKTGAPPAVQEEMVWVEGGRFFLRAWTKKWRWKASGSTAMK